MADQLQSYTTAEEVEEVRRKFESCAYMPDEFHHREHLIVALCYLREATEQEALERLRSNLFRFLAHHRIQENVYHETITLFWLKRVRHFLERADAGRTLAELASDLFTECGDPHLLETHFSKERLASDEARRAWVEPDLKPLDFYPHAPAT